MMKKQYVLAVQFGTLSVSAVLFEHADTECHVLGVWRHPLTHHLKTSAEDLVRSALAECYSILALIRKKHRTICPGSIRIGIASPYVISRTEMVRKTFPDARVFVQADVEDLLATGKQQFLNAIPAHGPLTLIEAIPMAYEVNGYATKHAIGQTGKELALAIRYSALPEAFSRAIQARAEGFGCPVDVSFHTGSALFQSLLAPQMHTDRAALILDVGGEVSEASIIIDGVIQNVATIPVGVGDILTHIESEFRIDAPSAATLFHQYLLDILLANDRDKIDEILHKVVGAWKSPLDAFIREHHELLERDFAIYILGGGALAADMKALIQTLSIFQEHQSAKLHIVDPSAYRDRIIGSVDFRGPEDMTLLALCLTSQ